MARCYASNLALTLGAEGNYFVQIDLLDRVLAHLVVVGLFPVGPRIRITRLCFFKVEIPVSFSGNDRVGGHLPQAFDHCEG